MTFWIGFGLGGMLVGSVAILAWSLCKMAGQIPYPPPENWR